MKCRLNRCLLVAVVFILAAACPTTASSLIEAASKGDTKKVCALLAKGADVNAKTNYAGATALMLAAIDGHTDIVHALLAGGADVNVKSNDGFTALMGAKENDHKEIIQMLKNAGPDVNKLIQELKDESWSVRMFAAQSLGEIGDPRAVEPLIEVLKDQNPDVRIGAAWALVGITGKDFEQDTLKWQKWWEENKEKLQGGR